MTEPLRSWIEISEAALAHNLHAIQNAAGPETEVLAVVKADAYGHGAALCAQSLARAGARWFGVTDAAEGARVHQALQQFGHEGTPEILVMCGPLPEEAATFAEHTLTPVVWTPEHISPLRNLPHKKIQIEIDTGMGRQGTRPGPELDALLTAIRTSDLRLDGVFTHLCASEVAHSPLTEIQKQRFQQAVAQIRAHTMQPTWLHIGNSSTLDNIDPAAPSAPWLNALSESIGARPMVRTGLALYGYTLPIHPDPQSAPPANHCHPEQSEGPASSPKHRSANLGPHLQPVLTWKARILTIRTLAPGDTVGYGATFTATQTTRIALLPVGYADGLRRELSNPTTSAGSSHTEGGWAIAHTPDSTPHRCPILGRISMNLTVIDISAVPTLAPGDPVTILGPGITADDHARLAHTIPYEILCGIHNQAQLLQP